jgi:hypothetical protein
VEALQAQSGGKPGSELICIPHNVPWNLTKATWLVLPAVVSSYMRMQLPGSTV